jgi:hypothetical protein
MTVSVKINPGLVGGDRTASIDRYAARLYESSGMALMGVVELVHVDSVVPAEGSKKDPQVRMEIRSMEVAGGEQEHTLRDVQRFLYLARTAVGTLDGDNEVQLAKQTMENAQGLIAGDEVARLRAALGWVLEQLDGIGAATKLREADMRKAIGKLAASLTAIQSGAEQRADGVW